LPAKLEPALEREVRELSARVAAAAELRGVARIDFLEREGEILVNEVNTIPGSMAAYLWIDPPLTRERLFTDMLAEAVSNPMRVFSTAGSDGTALRNAGTIASKLG
jgi:D-alanine-D-alanine ligase